MKYLIGTSLALLVAAGGLLVWPKSPDAGRSAVSPLSIEIRDSDPGDVAGVKFLALWADGVSREADLFEKRLRNNPQSQEFAGPAAAAAQWHQISQDVLVSSQMGLAKKIETIQDQPDGWVKAADYQRDAAKGWKRAAEALSRLAQSQGK